jgi:hypothetical protein
VSLTRDQAWELRKLQGARRSLVNTRVKYIKMLDRRSAAETEILIEKMDQEIEKLQDLSRDV